MFQVRKIKGDLTNGEVRTLAAMALSEEAETVETFAVIGFIHRGTNDHDLIIGGNLCDALPLLSSLLEMGSDISKRLSPVDNDGVGKDSHKTRRIVATIKTSWWQWW